MVKLPTFLLERSQSLWENRVGINLSESGVDPLSVGGLLELAHAAGETSVDTDALLGTQLVYPQTNGTELLRRRIAGLYPGTGGDGVQVTTGGAEANFVSALQLVQPGDRVVVMLPNYMQIFGLATGLGAEVAGWPLVLDSGDGRWRPDLDTLASLVDDRTKLIAICNPNNPTGSRMREAEVQAVCDTAARHGAWVLSDEIYRGAEFDGELTPTAWGRCERVVCTSGLSKAYGLPGLRIGWVAGAPEHVAETWAIHDYTTIAPAALSDRLACVALEPNVRAAILERTRGILQRNLELLGPWLDERADQFDYVAPEAGGMMFLRYEHKIGSTALSERLRCEHDVLVVPGDHYGMDSHLRIGFGGKIEQLSQGLAALQAMLAGV